MASGMSRGAIYHLYTSKLDILQALMQRAQNESLHKLQTLVEITSQTATQRMVHIFSMAFYASPLQHELVADDWTEKIPFALLDTVRFSLEEFAPLLADLIRQGFSQHEFCCENLILAAEAIVVFVDIWLDPVLFRRTHGETNERVAYATDMLLFI